MKPIHWSSHWVIEEGSRSRDISGCSYDSLMGSAVHSLSQSALSILNIFQVLFGVCALYMWYVLNTLMTLEKMISQVKSSFTAASSFLFLVRIWEVWLMDNHVATPKSNNPMSTRVMPFVFTLSPMYMHLSHLQCLLLSCSSMQSRTLLLSPLLVNVSTIPKSCNALAWVVGFALYTASLSLLLCQVVTDGCGISVHLSCLALTDSLMQKTEI